MKCSTAWLVAMGLVLALAMPIPMGKAQAVDDAVQVKVHKDRIRLLAGDEAVQVIGSSGAIEATAAVRAYLRHEESKEKTSFDVAADGGFQAVIKAIPGDKLRVYAHVGDKSSYGTFTVPAVSPPSQISQPEPAASLSAPVDAPTAQLSVSQVTPMPEPALEDIEALGLDPVKLRRELIKAHQENIRLRRELQRVWLQLEQLQKSLTRLLQDCSSPTSAVLPPIEEPAMSEK